MLSYLETIKEDFSILDQKEKLEYLIELGKSLDDIPMDERTDDTRVPGCVSGVYISCSKDADGKLHYKGTSEALIVRGYVHILLEALDGLTPEEVTGAEKAIEDFISETGIANSMVASRANAFGNVFAHMKKLAETA